MKRARITWVTATVFIVVFSTSSIVDGQFFPPFFPIFPPPPPPDFFLQARLGGGFRAYLPDICGIEGFEFEKRANSSDEWSGGNVTSKTGDNWMYDDPAYSLNPGDKIQYRGKIRQNGAIHTNPDAEWIVPNLVEDYTPPPADPQQQCPPSAASQCPFQDSPEPGDSPERVIQKQMARLQCDMMMMAERSNRLYQLLNQQLMDLKKLNYHTVTRIQRLETLIRALPRTLAFPGAGFL